MSEQPIPETIAALLAWQKAECERLHTELAAEHARREAAERERDVLRDATGLTPEGAVAVVEKIAERLLEPTKRITDELRQRAEAAEQRLARVHEALQTAMGALADIGYSEDIRTLSVAVKKAKRTYVVLQGLVREDHA